MLRVWPSRSARETYAASRDGGSPQRSHPPPRSRQRTSSSPSNPAMRAASRSSYVARVLQAADSAPRIGP
jgi:hypothetical protein